MRGDLTRDCLPDVLRQIYMERRSGSLRLIQDSSRKEIFFELGAMIFASSNRREDRIGETMLRHGTLTKENFDLVQSQMGRGKRFGKVLVELGLISDRELLTNVTFQVLDIIYSVFNWTTGNYEFIEVEKSISDDLKLELSTASIILEGVRRINEIDVIERGLGDLNRLIGPSTNPLLRLQTLSLKPLERQIIELTRTPISLFRILISIKATAESVLRAIYGLLSAGVLDQYAAAELSQSSGKLIVPEDIRQNLSEPIDVVTKRSTGTNKVDEMALRRRIDLMKVRISHGNHYEILGVTPDMNREEINTAYYKLARDFHPDRYLQAGIEVRSEVEEIFTQLTNSFEMLRSTPQTILKPTATKSSITTSLPRPNTLILRTPTSQLSTAETETELAQAQEELEQHPSISVDPGKSIERDTILDGEMDVVSDDDEIIIPVMDGTVTMPIAMPSISETFEHMLMQKSGTESANSESAPELPPTDTLSDVALDEEMVLPVILQKESTADLVSRIPVQTDAADENEVVDPLTMTAYYGSIPDEPAAEDDQSDDSDQGINAETMTMMPSVQEPLESLPNMPAIPDLLESLPDMPALPVHLESLPEMEALPQFPRTIIAQSESHQPAASTTQLPDETETRPTQLLGIASTQMIEVLDEDYSAPYSEYEEQDNRASSTSDETASTDQAIEEPAAVDASSLMTTPLSAAAVAANELLINNAPESPDQQVSESAESAMVEETLAIEEAVAQPGGVSLEDEQQAEELFYDARTRFQAKDFAAAARRLREAVRLDPRQTHFRLLLGHVLSTTPRWHKEAEEVFKQALEIEENAMAHVGLGQLYIKMDYFKSAEKAFRAALKLEPNNPVAKKGLKAVLNEEAPKSSSTGFLSRLFIKNKS